jgi:glycosyltransferase involved in cell wall biosynthesis
MIRLLRPAGPTDLLTAQAFEALFQRHIGGVFGLRRVPLGPWCDDILGPAEAPVPSAEAARRFAARTAGADFLCPDYQGIPLAPLFLSLRNRSRARVRLLLIGHAVGADAAEWALLPPLLAPGDVILAPSQSARRTIEYLAPALMPFVHVAPHPMAPPAPPPADAPRRGQRLVSLGRIHAAKLLHREIDAMRLLLDRGRTPPPLEIAGALDDLGTGGPHAYARALDARIERLALRDHVRLVGPIRGDPARAAFLSGAALMLNLSSTVEESFPKSPVEALWAGVPVLATAWDGLHEAVGECGELLPLAHVGPHPGTLDVAPSDVADGIERLLDAPPSPELCRAHAARFAPERSIALYRQALEEGRSAAEAAGWATPDLPHPDVPAAPARGLLASAPPLTVMGWTELFESHVASCAWLRETWRGRATAAPPDYMVRPILDEAVRPGLERFMAGMHLDAASEGLTAGTPPVTAPRDWTERFAAAAAATGLATGRVACLEEVVRAAPGRASSLAQRLRGDGIRTVGLEALAAEAQLRDGRAAEALEPYALDVDRTPPGEFEAYRIRLLARLARAAGRPSLALPYLQRWLGAFPDSQESGPVWLELAVTAQRAGAAYRPTERHALTRARALLGPIPAVLTAERALAGRIACAAVA